MNNYERNKILNVVCKIQDIQIRHLKKELSYYRDKYTKLLKRYNYENRKNRNKD